MDAERTWQDAAAVVEGELQVEAVEEAYEVYVAEAARTRLTDREGPGLLRLSTGSVIEGEVVVDDPIHDHLQVRLATGDIAVVPLTALICLRGTRPSLRREAREETRTLTSWLRSCWLAGVRMRAVTVDGLAWSGTISHVAADHVALVDDADDCWLIGLASVEHWLVARDAG